MKKMTEAQKDSKYLTFQTFNNIGKIGNLAVRQSFQVDNQCIKQGRATGSFIEEILGRKTKIITDIKNTYIDGNALPFSILLI